MADINNIDKFAFITKHCQEKRRKQGRELGKKGGGERKCGKLEGPLENKAIAID